MIFFSPKLFTLCEQLKLFRLFKSCLNILYNCKGPADKHFHNELHTQHILTVFAVRHKQSQCPRFVELAVLLASFLYTYFYHSLFLLLLWFAACCCLYLFRYMDEIHPHAANGMNERNKFVINYLLPFIFLFVSLWWIYLLHISHCCRSCGVVDGIYT